MSLEIRFAYQDIDKVKQLFQEYSTMLGINLGFQGFDDELLTLPADYALPQGRLFLAFWDGKLAGCIALRPFGNNCCEMKRLFVRPEYRGKKIGRALVERVISEAKAMRYKSMLLDTLLSLSDSIALYKKVGFEATEPYRFNPLSDVLYLRLKLQ